MELLVPAGITEEQVREWVSVLVERKVNQALTTNPAVASATAAAKVEIDTYRKAVGLTPKYEVVEAPVDPVEPK